MAAPERERTRSPLELVPGGPESAGALDRDARAGRGGEGAAIEPSVLLFAFMSPITLQDTELNNLAVNQTQRIHTGRARATQEERRATPHPASSVLVVSGERGPRERRTPASREAASGTVSGAGASALGTVNGAGAGASEAGLATMSASARPSGTPGSATRTTDRGVLNGQGRVQTARARVAFARPNIDMGPAATPAEQIDPQIRDDVDAELLAAKLQRSLVDASVQRARERSAGAGGAVRGAGLAETGTDTGARALPFLPGAGEFGALDTRDARYVRWFVEQRDRLQRELVFPDERALAMDQGTTVLRIVIGRDGKLRGEPSLVRSSGFTDFDSAAFSAVRKAAPFAPLPRDLAPELERIGILVPIAFSNPMVR